MRPAWRTFFAGFGIGLAGGTIAGGLAVAVAFLAPEGVGPGAIPIASPTRPAVAPSPVPERAAPEGGIEERVAALLAGRRFEEAGQAIADHERGLDSEARGRVRPLLDRLGRRFHEAGFPHELGPEELGRLVARHREAREDGRLEAALACLTLFIESHPQPDPAHYVNRADLLEVLGRREAALADLDRAQALDRGSSEASIVEVRCHVLVGLFRFEEARECARRYAEIGRDPGQGHELLAEVHYVEGRLEDARAEMERARAIETHFALLTDLAVVHLGLADREGALEVLEEAERLASSAEERNMAKAGQAWAWLHPEPGEPDLERARAHMLRLEKCPMRRPLENLTRGAFQSVAGDHESAVRLFGFCARQWTGYPEFGFHYARSLRALGRVEEAEHVLALAKRLRPALARRLEGR